jgi:hypothetical protein
VDAHHCPSVRPQQPTSQTYTLANAAYPGRLCKWCLLTPGAPPSPPYNPPPQRSVHANHMAPDATITQVERLQLQTSAQVPRVMQCGNHEEDCHTRSNYWQGEAQAVACLHIPCTSHPAAARACSSHLVVCVHPHPCGSNNKHCSTDAVAGAQQQPPTTRLSPAPLG